MITEQNTKFPPPFYYLIFQINTKEEFELKSLFTNLKSFFENFPILRRGGWDLKIGSGSEYSIDLEGIEHVDSSKRIRVLESGGLIIQGALSADFLCWRGGQIMEETNESKKILSLALIEFTYSSFIALQKILQDTNNSANIDAEIGFAGIDDQFSLRYNKAEGYVITLEEKFTNKRNNFKQSFKTDDLSNKNLPATVFIVVSKLYRMFNLEETEIPYTKEVTKRKVIDIEQIRNIR